MYILHINLHLLVENHAFEFMVGPHMLKATLLTNAKLKTLPAAINFPSDLLRARLDIKS